MSPSPDLAAWLTLCLTPGLGGSKIRVLLKHFGPPGNVLNADRTELARIAGHDAAIALTNGGAHEAVDRALRWVATPGHEIVTLADSDYPALLLEISDPPPLVYAQGDVRLLNRLSLAVVGSRNATAQGLRNAEAFSKAFSQGGLTVVSGLALGIDA